MKFVWNWRCAAIQMVVILIIVLIAIRFTFSQNDHFTISISAIKTVQIMSDPTALHCHAFWPRALSCCDLDTAFSHCAISIISQLFVLSWWGAGKVAQNPSVSTFSVSWHILTCSQAKFHVSSL